jgi:anti-sigma28 factor (negative regulator of flagellin synthesis)
VSPSEQQPPSSPLPLNERRDKVRHLKELVAHSAYQVPADKVADEIIREALVSLPPHNHRH